MIGPVDFQSAASGGAVTTLLLSVVFGMRRFLRKEGVDAASDKARIDTIEQLRQSLADERAARKLSDERADKFAEERNDAIQKIGELNGKITALEQQVASLKEVVERLSVAVHAEHPEPKQ
jgi:septal ring factor EnvC (AmiA/AmiB activator)